jgi:hypothetical protein
MINKEKVEKIFYKQVLSVYAGKTITLELARKLAETECDDLTGQDLGYFRLLLILSCTLGNELGNDLKEKYGK